MKQEQYPVWRTERGRDLIRIEGEGMACVLVSICSPEECEELAEAAVAAAAVLRGEAVEAGAEA